MATTGVQDDTPSKTHDKRKFTRHLFMTALTAGVLPLTSLITGPVIARALGPDGRGESAGALAILFVAVSVCVMAIPEGCAYLIARRPGMLRKVAGIGAGISFLYGAIGAALVYVLAPYLLSDVPNAIDPLRSLIWTAPFLCVELTMRSVVMGSGRYGLVNVMRIVSALLRLSGIAGLAAVGELTVTWVLAINSVATIASAVLGAPVLMQRRSSRPGADERIQGQSQGSMPADIDPVRQQGSVAPSSVVQAPVASPSVGRELAGYGARGWPGTLGNLISWRLDQAIMGAFVGPAQLGYYAVAAALSEIPTSLLGSSKGLLLSEAARRKESELIARAARVTLILAVIGAASLTVLAPWVIRLLFGSDFLPATAAARILLAAGVLLTLEEIYGAGLLALGLPGRRSLSHLVAGSLTVVGVLTLVPAWGINGAAIVSMIAYGVSCLITMIFFKRRSGIAVSRLIVPTMSDVRWLVETASRLLAKLLRRARAE